MKHIDGKALTYEQYRDYVLGRHNKQKKKKKRVKPECKAKPIKYYVYIKSEEWKKKRDYIMELYNYSCYDCMGRATQVHHLTYKNLGHEKDEDLIPLCRTCHRGRHNLLKHCQKEIK